MRPCKSNPAQFPRRGLTLLEFLVAIGILALLLALLLPATQRVRDAAARARCASNLRQLALAIHSYEATHSQFPQGCAYPYARTPYEYTMQPGISWQTSILPFVEQDALWNLAWSAHSQSPTGESDLFHVVLATGIPIFKCPSDPRQAGRWNSGVTWALTSYVGIAGTSIYEEDGVLCSRRSVRMTEILDGTSNTLMIGEHPPGPSGTFGSWFGADGLTCPTTQIRAVHRSIDITAGAGECPFAFGPLCPGRLESGCDIDHFWSLHSSGANFAFADGSVHFMRYGQSSVLILMATRAGGEIVTLD